MSRFSAHSLGRTRNDSDLIIWGAVSDLSLISDLSQKFKHDLWRVKSELNLSQKQHLTPVLIYVINGSIWW